MGNDMMVATKRIEVIPKTVKVVPSEKIAKKDSQTVGTVPVIAPPVIPSTFNYFKEIVFEDFMEKAKTYKNSKKIFEFMNKAADNNKEYNESPLDASRIEMLDAYRTLKAAFSENQPVKRLLHAYVNQVLGIPLNRETNPYIKEEDYIVDEANFEKLWNEFVISPK